MSCESIPLHHCVPSNARQELLEEPMVHSIFSTRRMVREDVAVVCRQQLNEVRRGNESLS